MTGQTRNRVDIHVLDTGIESLEAGPMETAALLVCSIPASFSSGLNIPIKKSKTTHYMKCTQFTAHV